MSPEVKNVYLCIFNLSGDSGESEVTDDESYAKTIDPDYSLASKLDLIEHWRDTGEVFSGILNTYDGLVRWVENEDPELAGYQLIKEMRLVG